VDGDGRGSDWCVCENGSIYVDRIYGIVFAACSKLI